MNDFSASTPTACTTPPTSGDRLRTQIADERGLADPGIADDGHSAVVSAVEESVQFGQLIVTTDQVDLRAHTTVVRHAVFGRHDAVI